MSNDTEIQFIGPGVLPDDLDGEPIIINSDTNEVLTLFTLGPPGPVGPAGIQNVTANDGSLIAVTTGTANKVSDVEINPAHSNTFTAPQTFGTLNADLINAPIMGNVTGDVTGNLTGNVIGNVTGNVSGSSSSFTGTLNGDVTGNQSTTLISSTVVTGKLITGFTSGAGTLFATDSILQAIQKLDGNIGTKQALGNYLTAITGDVTASGPGSAAATVVSVGGSSAALIHNAELKANASTASNTVSTIVRRDGSGNFSAGVISADLIGNVTGNVSGSANTFTGNLAGDVTGTQGATAISSTVITGKILTGFASLAGTVSASDSILVAFEKLDGNTRAIVTSIGASNGIAPLGSDGKVPNSYLPSAVMEFQGAWNASTNVPTLADGTGRNGDVYRTSVAGTQTFGGVTAIFNVGDFIIYNGTIWQHAPAADGVVSVNSKTGAVVLSTSDIAEGSNLYFTNFRAISATLTGFTSATGTITSSDTILSALQKLYGNASAMVSGVSSVFGRAGAVVATAGDYDTSLVTENGNLYFTNARVRTASLTGYVSGAGVITATDTVLAAIQKLNGNTAALITGVSSVYGRTGAVVSASGDYTTAQVTESGSLYYTNARGIGSVLTGYTSSAGTVLATDSILQAIQKLNGNIGAISVPVTSVFGRTGAIVASTGDYTTAQVTESGNLYYTNSRGIGSVLTGYTSGAGTVSATDSILQAIQKLNGNIAAVTGSVLSVFGRVGAIVAVSGDYNSGQVTESGNLYFTQGRVIASPITGFTSGAGTLSATDSILQAIQKLDGNVNGKQAAGSYQPAGNYITALSGDVTASGPGSAASVIQTNVVGNTKLAQMAAHTHKGNNTGATANAIDLTSAQLTADLVLFSSTLQGLVPPSGGGTANYLRADGTWAPVTSGFTNPMTTAGDMIYGGTSGAATRLPGGSNGQYLVYTAGVPTWISPTGKSSQNFSGDGSTTVFTLSVSTTTANTDIFIYGVKQNQSSYTVSGTSLTFSSPPATGINNIEVITASAITTLLSTPVANDIEVTDTTKGFVLKAPNGTRWRITVDNSGTLIRTSI